MSTEFEAGHGAILQHCSAIEKLVADIRLAIYAGKKDGFFEKGHGIVKAGMDICIEDMKRDTQMAEQELIDNLKRAAGVLSYHNAAESNWGDERVAREKAKEKFAEAVHACREAGIDPYPHMHGYLL